MLQVSSCASSFFILSYLTTNQQQKIHLAMTISSISWSDAFSGNFWPFVCSLNANNILHKKMINTRLDGSQSQQRSNILMSNSNLTLIDQCISMFHNQECLKNIHMEVLTGEDQAYGTIVELRASLNMTNCLMTLMVTMTETKKRTTYRKLKFQNNITLQ